MTVLLLAIIVVLGLVVVWLGRPGGYRGGTIDLTVPAARGELDLDWADPRAKQQAQEFSDHWLEQAKIAARR